MRILSRGMMVVALTVLAALTARPTVTVQAQSQPRFEVASLKERDRTVPFGTPALQRSPGRLISRCATLTSLVSYAFQRTWSTPIEGLPGWASTPCNDTDTANTYEFQATMPVETTDANVRLMLQAFLTERFKLAFHWETRTLPVLALVVAPGGFKVKPTDPKDDKPRAPGSGVRGRIPGATTSRWARHQRRRLRARLDTPSGARSSTRPVFAKRITST